MQLAKHILGFLGRKEGSEREAPEGLCPNCWGRQEYGGKFYEAVKTQGLDINTKDEHTGWVQEYANKHLLDIQLKHDDDMLVCGHCKITYRES